MSRAIILIRLITKRRHICHSVDDRHKAVDAFCTRGNEFDVALMDIQMPIKWGIEARFDLGKIERENCWRRHQIVALTGRV